MCDLDRLDKILVYLKKTELWSPCFRILKVARGPMSILSFYMSVNLYENNGSYINPLLQVTTRVNTERGHSSFGYYAEASERTENKKGTARLN